MYTVFTMCTQFMSSLLIGVKKHIPGVGSLPNQHISIAFSLAIRNTVWFGYLEEDYTVNFARNPVVICCMVKYIS